MKKRQLVWVVVLLSLMLILSCSKSPQEKIVGDWIYTMNLRDNLLEVHYVFDEDGFGVIKYEDVDEGRDVLEQFNWKLIGEKEPYDLIFNPTEFSSDDDVEILKITFVSNNELKGITGSGETMTFKRNTQ